MNRAVLLCLISLIGFSVSTEANAQKRRSTRARTADAQPSYDPAKVNDPNIAMGHEAKALGILRAQILLDRAHFSPGQIDAQTGRNFERAVRAFQEARSVAQTGQLDAQTWSALNSDTAPVLVPYRLTAEDLAGPFTPVPKDMMEQSKLQKLGYETPEEAVAEQFHISPHLLKRINTGRNFVAEQEIIVPNVLNPPTGKAAQIVVSKAGTLQALDAEGKIIAHYPCSSGSTRDPLPIGKWKINGVAKNPPFHYNPDLFWDADPGHAKAKIAPGPNNPVGVVWIDLSKEHYGIHGAPTPESVGHTQSHGCIRLTNWDAMELASLVSAGTPAVLKD
jgi:lipoprotein-anchoring transpeptidase ErfK/SrfK